MEMSNGTSTSVTGFPPPPPALRITICGGGNLAHCAAAYLGSKSTLDVRVLTRQPQRWSNTIRCTFRESSWAEKGEIDGRISKVTDRAEEVIPTSDIVLIGAPAHAHPPILANVVKALPKDRKVLLGCLYAQGGFEWAARAAFAACPGSAERVEALFGLQNIPWICKLEEYGKRCWIFGPKRELWVAASPVEFCPVVAPLVASLFDIPTNTVPNFLCLTLTPSNQIIHPARYYGLFSDYDGKKVYKKEEIQWGLYYDMDDTAADWLQKLDDELQAIKKALCSKFPQLDLSPVLPIGERIIKQYGADVRDTSSLRNIFRTNNGYIGCITPTEVVESGDPSKPAGYRPAVKSRLFWEDIPFGLCILKGIAEKADVPTPTIDFMIKWHQQFMGKEYIKEGASVLNTEILKETAAPGAYSLNTLEDIVATSLPTQQKGLKNWVPQSA